MRIVHLTAVFMAWTALVGTGLAMMGQFRTLPVVIVSLAVLVSYSRATRRWDSINDREGKRSQDNIVLRLRFHNSWTIMFVMGAMFIGALNALRAGEDILMRRDPAVYLNAAVWIRESGGLTDRISGQLFAGLPRLSMLTPGIYEMPNGSIELQFLHGLPSLLAVLGSADDALMFALPAIVSAGAAIASFQMARMLGAGSGIAAISMTVLMASVPYAYAARSTYSEPFAAILLLTGLVVAARGIGAMRLPMVSAGAFLVGSVQLFRVDGLLYGALFAAALYITDSTSRQPRFPRRERGFVFATYMAPVAAGLIDLIWFTGNYATDLATNIVGIAGLSAAGWAAFLVGPKWLGLSRLRTQNVFSPRAIAFAVSVTWIALLASFSLTELSSVAFWYGAALIFGAGVGLYDVLYRALRDCASEILFLTTFTASAVVPYIVRPAILPDQPWASRRLAVFAIYGLFGLAAVGISSLLSSSGAQSRPEIRHSVRVAAAGIISFVVVVHVLVPMDELIEHSPRRGERQMVAEICRSLGGADRVLVSTSVELVFPIRSQCGLPTAFVDLATDSLNEFMRKAAAASATVGIVAPQSQLPVLEEYVPNNQPVTVIQASVGPRFVPVDFAQEMLPTNIGTAVEYHRFVAVTFSPAGHPAE